ncbi:hypothetical protein IQ268_29000 [Oculatella sp. LEGE 06141]|uniref:hypothetical protein n=1 Tax=Oculatella sp. LEGE 06141 TaxID=1828648 RepID=UPI0018827887|nr:hypothetical protein [Oculatella sp. LEGE 06141]MBE9182591.1 hypothetical protein [Oculatella sp. LEGE 06141]
MRCAISSRAGQVLAAGSLVIQEDDEGNWRLNLQTDSGRMIQGGVIGADGSLAEASQVLFRQFFDLWGMSDLTLTARVP